MTSREADALARILVLRDESPDLFHQTLNDHVTRFQPADGVEFGLIEEMAAAHWRLRRTWAISTRILESQAAVQPGPDPLDRKAAAFAHPDTQRSLDLFMRYETRPSACYGRALRALFKLGTLVLRTPALAPNPTLQR